MPIIIETGNQIAKAKDNKTGVRLFYLTILALFLISYLERYFFLSFYVRNNLPVEGYPDWDRVVRHSLRQSVLISSALFGLFFLAASPFVRGRSRDGHLYRTPSTGAIVLLTLMIVASLVLRFAFGARLGEEAVSLPLGLSTLLYRSQSDLIPGLILLLIEVYFFQDKRRNYVAAIVGLAIFNIALSAITTSKAGMIYFLVQLVFIMYLTGQRVFNKPLRILVISVLGLLVFIISSQARQIALTGTDSSIFVALKQGNVLETLLQVAGLVLNRLPGVEGLALSCGYDCSSFDMAHFPALNGTAGRLYTQQIIGVASDYDFRSPGFIGGAFLIAGWGGGALLTLAFLISCVGLLAVADRGYFSSAFKALLVFGLFRFILEGTWAAADLASLAAGAAIVEIVARNLAQPGNAGKDAVRLSDGRRVQRQSAEG